VGDLWPQRSFGVCGVLASAFVPSFTVGSEGGESRSGFAAKLWSHFSYKKLHTNDVLEFFAFGCL